MIALDSSVLIDVLTSDPVFGDTSAAKLESAMERDDVVICDVALAEVAARVN
ncbi:MAG: PIN domain-containing protein, partial [Burkholderiales bacterium]